MRIKPFHTERFFALHEFSAPHILCASDCEPMTVDELLRRAGLSRSCLGQLHLGYTETQGAPALRESIATLYQQVDSGQVIGLSAPEEGIFLTMHALLRPGDEVVVLVPCYDSLVNVADYLGCRLERWPVVNAGPLGGGPNRWRLDLEDLRWRVTSRTKLVIVNFPHNPTGLLPTLSDWQALLQIVESAGAWLFSDEMYRGLELNPADRLPSGCDSYERAITLGGLSKAYGLPGLRTGWLVLKDKELRGRIINWKDYTTICASAPSELLAQVALSIAARLEERCRRIIVDNLRAAEPFFARRSEIFRWNPPQAGSVALVGLERGSATAFCESLVAEQGVLLLPSTGLGFGDGHVRFGFGRRGFPAALEQLELYLDRGNQTAV
jgi:aspartate/methionine/tyrosine aminotransferase